jgi:hypothetical protein
LLGDSAYPPPWENISMIPKKSLEWLFCRSIDDTCVINGACVRALLGGWAQPDSKFCLHPPSYGLVIICVSPRVWFLGLTVLEGAMNL